MKYITTGWTSEYRRKKFLERHNSNDELDQDSKKRFLNDDIPKTIAVMLDYEGVTDDIDLQGASIFIRELETLRKRFQAKYCYICISTHDSHKEGVKEVLDILSTFTKKNKNMIIGKSFLYGYLYDYQNDTLEDKGTFFNTNKMETFKSYYLNNYGANNVWFLVCDDTLSSDQYTRYKEVHPCLFIKPGSNDISNFMYIATNTKGFDGVIESLDVYIRNTNKMNLNQIKEEQREMISHLSSSRFIDKIRNHEFEFLIKYFALGYADNDDYNDAISWLSIISDSIQEDEINYVLGLLDIIKSKSLSEEVEMKILELSGMLSEKA